MAHLLGIFAPLSPMRGLLYNFEESRGFFGHVDFKLYAYHLSQMILSEYRDKICANADIDTLIKYYPRELAYALALIGCEDPYSVTPPWLLKNFPRIENVIKVLCNTPCEDDYAYCRSVLDVYTKA